MRLFWVRLLAGLLFCVPLLSAQQYVFRAYRQSDGLKNLAVRSLAKDCDGYLWLATENGVFRFLGSGFDHFGQEQGMPELGVQEVVVDGGCTVWAGTTQNVYRFDGERFRPAGPTPVSILNPHGMATETADSLLLVDKDRLFRLEYAASGNIRSYQQALPVSDVSSISVLHETATANHIWVGAGKKLYSLERVHGRDGSVSVWGTEQGLPEDHWESVAVDGQGTLWAEGQRHIVALPKGAAKFIDRSFPLSAQGNLFLRSRLVIDTEGRVVAPTEEGVARWENGHWKFVDRSHGLPRNNEIGAMMVDGSGDLWLGSYGDGLYNWSGYAQWEGWGDEQGLPSSIIWAIDSSQPGRVIAGTDKGPAWVDAGSGAVGSLVQGKRWMAGLIVAMGREPGGIMWAATNSGSIVRFDDRTGRLLHESKLPASILSAFEDSNGHLYLGTDQGFYTQQSPIAQPQPIPEANALLGDVKKVDGACKTPDGASWFLAGNHLIREAAGQWSEPSAPALPGRKVGRLLALSCASNGDLWVTGQHIGPWRLTPVGNSLAAWHLEPPRVFGSIDSYAILADRRGWVWLGTDQGLLVWNGSGWRHLTEESGMLSNDIDEWGLSQSSDGSLWVGTSGGLLHLLHPERIFDPVPMPVSITGLRRGDVEYPALDRIDLPWSPLPLRFQISSPLVRNRSDLVFKYQVEGTKSGWIESRDGQAVLSGIGPGSYTFLAMASNQGLNANSGVDRITIVIRPPWWRKTWFLALAALAMLALLIMATQLYGHRVRRRSRQLEELVRQRTRELEESREQLRILATIDGLTGMMNRSAILEKLRACMEKARSQGQPLLLALADVDHFKQINDTYGHLVGDQVLRLFANALRKAARLEDGVGRYGGEEFLLVMVGVSPQQAPERLAALHATISGLTVSVSDAEIKLYCSIGAAIFEPGSDQDSVELLLAAADMALYAAKSDGRNRFLLSGRPSLNAR